MPYLVDSHCHLDFPEFAEERDQVVERAKVNGVGMMLTIGTKMSTFPRVKSVAEAYDNIYCSFGIHPHEVENEPTMTAEQIIAITHDPNVVGIGETGLDYYYEHSPRALQQQSFREHIKAARATGLPLIVHTRDADEDTVAILEEEMKLGIFTGLIHCFSSSKELAERMIAIGFYISISGILTFKKADGLRAIIAELPLERLLVETDSPYLAPLPHRGKRNEPAYTRLTAEFLAGFKKVSYEEVAAQTTVNFFKLFTKVTPA